MILREAKNQLYKRLQVVYSLRECNTIFLSTLIHILNKSKTEVRLLQAEHYTLTRSEEKKFHFILNELAEEKPLQYIIGKTDFYGLSLKVNQQVLIPRPETEELVDWIICEVKKEQKPDIKILDIGTGSGCIAIALKKNLPHAKVYALDISKKALETANKNALLHHVKISFKQRNILIDSKNDDEKYELIVSNPPYITPKEKKEMRKNVLAYEPPSALFVNGALVFYKRIAKLGIEHLTEGGSLFFEINQYYAAEIAGVLKKLNYKKIELRKDLQGNYRMIKALLS